jgi:hypothetical protein
VIDAECAADSNADASTAGQNDGRIQLDGTMTVL